MLVIPPRDFEMGVTNESHPYLAASPIINTSAKKTTEEEKGDSPSKVRLEPLNSASPRVEGQHVRRLIAFGDSLTEGFLSGGWRFHPYSEALEETLNHHFNHTRFEVLNEGISGECVNPTMLSRLPKVLQRLGDRVDCVLILGGSNDLYKPSCWKNLSLEQAIIQLHEIAHQAGLKTLLMTIPKRSDLTPNDEQRRIETNTKLKEWAQNNANVTWLLDLSTKLPTAPEYWDDDVHLSEHGYDVMASLIYHSLEKMYQDLTSGVTDSTMEDDDSSGDGDDSDSGSGPVDGSEGGEDGSDGESTQ